MRIPMKVRIAGDYYEPVVLRIESIREHDGLPDQLTHIAPKDHAELSQNPKQNQFKVVYAKVNQFTSRHEDPARPELLPGQDPEILNLMPLFSRHLANGQALHLSWDDEKALMRVIMTELEEQDGKPIAKPVEVAHIGEVKDQKQTRAITPHTLAAALLQILIKREKVSRDERTAKDAAIDGGNSDSDVSVDSQLPKEAAVGEGSPPQAEGSDNPESGGETGAGKEDGDTSHGSKAS